MRIVPLVLLSLAVGPLSCSAARPADQPTKPAALADEPSPGFRLPDDTRPVAVSLSVDVNPDSEGFSGAVKMKVHLDAARRTLWLHARHLDVKSATVAGLPARFAQVDDDGLARLALDAPVGPGDVDVEMVFAAKYNPALESVYRVQSGADWYVFTQFEAISAREAFPCFDEPRFKVPVTVAITAKKTDVVVSNAAAASTAELPDGRVTTTFATTPPLPTYLVAFAVGPFDVVEGAPLPPSDVRKEPVPIRGIAVKGRAAETKASLGVAQRALGALERWFGVPYAYGKLDLVAVPDFAAGAMENAGMVTFRDSLLFVDERSPLSLQRYSTHVIAHELGHQWFGDLVTLAWWDDIWLNEAFATWIEIPVVNELRPDLHATTAARSDADWVMKEDGLVSARRVRQPVLSKGDINNAFDGITYDKGASVIEMFQGWVGAAAFQKGVREYMRVHAHGTTTVADLLTALTAAAGKDVATPFSTFLNQPGVPVVAAKLVCDAAKKTAVVELTQQRFLPVGSTGDRQQTWQLPVCVRFGDGRGGPGSKDLHTACTLLTEAAGTLPLDSTACPKLLHPNADGVGYYRWSLPADQLQLLSSSMKALTPGERISFANAVTAGLQAGTLPFADALAAAAPLARDEEADVAGTPLELMSFAWSHLVEPAARPLVAKRVTALYQPVFDAVRLLPKAGEDARLRERRALALNALVDVAEDKKLLAALAIMGREVLGLGDAKGKGADHRMHADKAPSDLIAMAIQAAVREGGAPVFDDLVQRLGSESDSQVRSWILSALGSVDDEALAGRARDLSLDPRLRVNEIMRPLRYQAGDVRTADATWAWLPAHADALLARLSESEGDAMVISTFSGFCSEARASEVESFARALKKPTPSLALATAQTVETIRLCAARRTAHSESARKLFAK